MKFVYKYKIKFDATDIFKRLISNVVLRYTSLEVGKKICEEYNERQDLMLASDFLFDGDIYVKTTKPSIINKKMSSIRQMIVYSNPYEKVETPYVESERFTRDRP